MAELAALAAMAGTAAGGTAVGTAAAGTAAAGISAGTVLTALGTGATVLGTIGAGYAAKEEAEFQAKQEERSAAEERAIGSRENEEQRRKTAMVLSEQKAKAASSGAGVVNPTILDIMGETEQYGDYLARSKIASGENKARGHLDQAAASRYKGKAAFKGAILEGIGQGFKGAGKVAGWG